MTTRSNASRARRRGHGDGDFAGVHDIELHSGITSNTREAPMLRGYGGTRLRGAALPGEGNRGAVLWREPLQGSSRPCGEVEARCKR
jgi:hypothetical protein